MTRKVLAANMWPALTFGNQNQVYQDFLSIGRPRFKSFLESILLYKEVHVPTDSFMSLSILVGVLGEKSILELLESRTLKFLRFKGSLAYVGNGGGLIAYQIGKNDPVAGHKPSSMFGEAEEAVDWALSGLNIDFDKKRLAREVLEATNEISMSQFIKETKDKAYRTVLESNDLREKFAVRNTNMDRLSGIQPNSVRTYGGNEKPDYNAPKDEIDTVLLIARSCLEALSAEKIDCTSINTATPVGYVIESEEAAKQHPFSSLQQVSGIPDIGESIIDGAVNLSELLRLRDSRHWPEFVDWFHLKCTSEPIEVAKAYIELLEEIPAVDKTSGRTLRFLVTSALGIANPFLGIAAAAADTYIVPKFREASPKYFVDDLKQLTTRQQIVSR